MQNPNEGGNFSHGFSIRDYHRKLERVLKAPLTSQMREAADVLVLLENNHIQEYQKNEGSFSALDNLLRTHPEDLSLIEGKVEVFSMAYSALSFLIKKDQVDNLSQRLLDSTGSNANTSTTAGLNDIFVPGPILSRALRGLRYACSFEGSDFPLGLIDKAKVDGSQEFLNALALSGKPLIPYQRNVGERIIDLMSTYDNRAVKGTLPTKVRGVTAQYVYLNSQSAPIMSIEIKRIP